VYDEERHDVYRALGVVSVMKYELLGWTGCVVSLWIQYTLAQSCEETSLETTSWTEKMTRRWKLEK
jgi:hypothetical protein